MAAKTNHTTENQDTKMPFEGLFETMTNTIKEVYNPSMLGMDMQENIQSNLKEFYSWQLENQKKLQEKWTAQNQELIKQIKTNTEQSIKLIKEGQEMMETAVKTQTSLINEYNKSMMDMMHQSFSMFK